MLERREFRDGQLRDSDVALKEIKSVVFAGFVFINFDSTPEPFDDFIAPVRQFLEDLAIGEMRHYWWKAIPIQSNWKVAQEAFFEGYHVPATHPQLEPKAADFIFGEQAGQKSSSITGTSYTMHIHEATAGSMAVRKRRWQATFKQRTSIRSRSWPPV